MLGRRGRDPGGHLSQVLKTSKRLTKLLLKMTALKELPTRFTSLYHVNYRQIRGTKVDLLRTGFECTCTLCMLNNITYTFER